MDPLSITVSVVTLIAAAGKTFDTLNKLWNLRHAPPEVALLMNEITDLRAVLDILRDAVLQSSPSIKRCIESLQKFVDKAASYILELDQLVQKINGQPNASTAKPRLLLVHIQWAKHKKEVLRFQQQIRECRINIQTALSAISTIQNQDQCTILLALQEAVISGGTSIRKGKDSVNTLDPETLLHEFERFSVVENTSSEQDKRFELNRPPITFSSPQNTTVIARTHHTSYFPGSREYLQIRAYPGKRTCAQTCPCQCHVKTRLKSPSWLRGVIGTLFCSYTGTPVNMRPCDYSKCRRCEPPSLELSYVFPGWVLARAVSLTMLWSCYTSSVSSMAVHISNVIPLSSPIFGDIITGSDQRVKDIFSQRLASPFDVDPFGRSLLHWAMDQMQPNISRLLIQTGADPLIVDSSGRTPIEICWERILMSSQTNDNTVQLKAICQGVDDSIGEDVSIKNNFGYSDVHLSVLGLSHKQVTEVLRHDSNKINAQDKLGRTALFWASSRGDISAVRCLLENGADPNIPDYDKGQTPLHTAAAGGLIDRVQSLLGASDAWIRELDLHPGPPLSFARVGAESRTKVMELLLQFGANVNAKNTIHSNTPLHQAVLLGIFENVKFLVDHGADIEQQNVNGGTPLDVSIWEHQIKTFRYLLSKNASFHYRTVFGENILHTIARTRNVDIMHVLASIRMEGADPDGRNDFGQTPDELFQTFNSAISPVYSMPNNEQRDAWLQLMESVRNNIIEEVDSSEVSSSSGEFVDTSEYI